MRIPFLTILVCTAALVVIDLMVSTPPAGSGPAEEIARQIPKAMP
jgi:hypothetical protein